MLTTCDACWGAGTYDRMTDTCTFCDRRGNPRTCSMSQLALPRAAPDLSRLPSFATLQAIACMFAPGTVGIYDQNESNAVSGLGADRSVYGCTNGGLRCDVLAYYYPRDGGASVSLHGKINLRVNLDSIEIQKYNETARRYRKTRVREFYGLGYTPGDAVAALLANIRETMDHWRRGEPDVASVAQAMLREHVRVNLPSKRAA